MSGEVISIFALTFNTQSIRLCESLDPQVVAEHRKSSSYLGGYVSVPSTWLYSCELPDFFIPILEKIKIQKPTVITVGFQESIRPGGYFHSHFLPETLPKYGYQLFDRTTLMGVGKTTMTGLYNADPFTRGLRLSVYIRSDASREIVKRFNSQTYTNSYFQNKGAAAIYLNLPTGEVLAIIDTHFPFNVASLNESVINKDNFIRDNYVYQQDTFFNEVYRSLIIESPAKPTYILFMGDLNYRIKPFENWSALATGNILLNTLASNPEQYSQLIKQYDEFWQQTNRQNIYPLHEGIDDKGPQFPPTCKMAKARDNKNLTISSYRTGKEHQRVPSHCDRILYGTLRPLGVSGPKLICKEYDMFDVGIMKLSDHAGVYGTFTFGL